MEQQAHDARQEGNLGGDRNGNAIHEQLHPANNAPNPLHQSYQQLIPFGTPSMLSLCSSVAPSTITVQQAQRLHENFIIDDYMQKINTKVELLENELKFAWRALDLLTTEYSKMANRLDKIDKLSGDQQLVVQNLINLILHKDRSNIDDLMAAEAEEEEKREAEAALASGMYNLNQLQFEGELGPEFLHAGHPDLIHLIPEYDDDDLVQDALRNAELEESLTLDSYPESTMGHEWMRNSFAKTGSVGAILEEKEENEAAEDFENVWASVHNIPPCNPFDGNQSFFLTDFPKKGQGTPMRSHEDRGGGGGEKTPVPGIIQQQHHLQQQRSETKPINIARSEHQLRYPGGTQNNTNTSNNQLWQPTDVSSKSSATTDATSSNFEHFKQKLEEMKMEVYAAEPENNGREELTNKSSTKKFHDYLAELLMTKNIGEGLEEGVEPPCTEFDGSDKDAGNIKDNNSQHSNKDSLANKKQSRMQTKKQMANEMKLLNEILLQKRTTNDQQESGEIDFHGEEESKKLQTVQLVTRILNARCRQVRSDFLRDVVSPETISFLHSEAAFLMKILYHIVKYTVQEINVANSSFYCELLGRIFCGNVDLGHIDDVVYTTNHQICSNFRFLKTMPAPDLLQYLQGKLTETRESNKKYAAVDLDQQSNLNIIGSLRQIFEKRIFDFTASKNDNNSDNNNSSSSKSPLSHLTSPSMYQFELIKMRYDLEESSSSSPAKGTTKEHRARSDYFGHGGGGGVSAEPKAVNEIESLMRGAQQCRPNGSEEEAALIANDNLYRNDEYIKSLKWNLERHNSMLFLLHLQEKKDETTGLQDDKNKLLIDLMMDKLLDNRDNQSSAFKQRSSGSDQDERSTPPPPPAPVAPFLCLDNDDDEEEEEDEVDDSDMLGDCSVDNDMYCGLSNVDFLENYASDLEAAAYGVDSNYEKVVHGNKSEHHSASNLRWDSCSSASPKSEKHKYKKSHAISERRVVNPFLDDSLQTYSSLEKAHYSKSKHHPSIRSNPDMSAYSRDDSFNPFLNSHQTNDGSGNNLDNDKYADDLMYLEQMGKCHPICSPYENQSRFAVNQNNNNNAFQSSTPPDLLRMYLKQQQQQQQQQTQLYHHHQQQQQQLQLQQQQQGGGSKLIDQLVYYPSAPSYSVSPERKLEQRQSSSKMTKRSSDTSINNSQDSKESKKKKFQMVAKLHQWFSEQPSTSGSSPSATFRSVRAKAVKKLPRFRSHSFSESTRTDDESEDREQYHLHDRRRSLMHIVKKGIGKRVKKIMVKDSMAASIDITDMQARRDPPKYRERPEINVATEFQTVGGFAQQNLNALESSQPVSDQEECGGNLFLKVGEHVSLTSDQESQNVSPHGKSNNNLSSSPLSQHYQKSSSLSSSNSTASSGGENGASGGMGGGSSSNSQAPGGPDAFLFSSTSMEFAASRKVGKYRKGKRGSSQESQSGLLPNVDSAGSSNNQSNHDTGKTVSQDKRYSDDQSDTLEEDNFDLDKDAITEKRMVFPEAVVPASEPISQKPQHPLLSKVNSIFIDEAETPDSSQEHEIFIDNKSPHPSASTSPQRQLKRGLSNPSSGVNNNNAFLSTSWGTSMDDEIKSVHSYRTVPSGGTSRRQSTEDSIDTDDEYFFYELRKLEAMEKASHETPVLVPMPSFTEEEPYTENQYEDESQTVYEIDPAIQDYFKANIYPELQSACKDIMQRKIEELSLYEKNKIAPSKRWFASGFADSTADRQLATRFYKTEVKHLDNPDVEDLSYASQTEESHAKTRKAKHKHRRSGSTSSASSAASSETTSGPESNPEVFSDYDNESLGNEGDEFPRHYDEQQEFDDKEEAQDIENNSAIIDLEEPMSPPVNEPTQDNRKTEGASKWKLLKTLKERKAEEKSNQDKIREEEQDNKVSYVSLLRGLSIIITS